MQLAMPLVVLVAFGGYYLYMMRARSAAMAQHADKTLGGISERSGLQLSEGDPNLNLLYFQQPSGDFARKVVMEGRPYGRPTRFLLTDGQATEEGLLSRVVQTTFVARLEVPCAAGFPPFEVRLRQPNEYLVAPLHLGEVAGLRETPTGDPQLDAQLLVSSTDPRVGPFLVAALRLLAHQHYVHLAGVAGTLTISFSRFGLASFATTPDEYVLALETAACSFEGRTAPVPGPMPGPSATASGGDTVPAPCARCGAPTQLQISQHVHAMGTLGCSFCGHTEALPSDAQERVRALRLRLVQVQRAREGDEAPLRTIDMLRKAWIPALLFLGLIVTVTLVQTFSTASELLGKPGIDAQTLLSVAWTPLMPVVGFFGYLGGYLGMMAGYTRVVKPLLRARPARAAGLAVRCRSCGGDLPRATGPEVSCPYCQATNLLDSTLTTRASELLEAEIGAYRARAQGSWSTAAFQRPLRAFYFFGAIGAAAGAGLYVVTLVILQALGVF